MNSVRPVQLTAPAERSSVRLARLVASGVGAEAGFSIDDTEDLRIAVSELVAREWGLAVAFGFLRNDAARACFSLDGAVVESFAI